MNKLAILDETSVLAPDMRGDGSVTCSDIEESLKKSGHSTCSYPNGFTIAVKLNGIPRTRGVHVDIVLILDLRVARFGASGLAMRAAILETANRPLKQILADVGLGGLYHEYSILNPTGRIRLPVLNSPDGKSVSYIHETRNIYVVTDGVRPAIDLSWLTESKRIVPASDFVLLRNSDARAMLPTLTEKIAIDKWSSLEQGIRHGWYGILPLVGFLVGLVSVLNSLFLGATVSTVPLVLAVLSLVAAVYLLKTSRKAIHDFQDLCTIEHERTDSIGDKNRIALALHNNRDLLNLVGELNFTVSPLMASAAEHLKVSDIDGAISLACSILDECVRHSPRAMPTDKTFGADEGLNKFLGLFDILGVQIEKEQLALAYVAFTGHPVNSIAEAEVAEHIGVLNAFLFDAGILRPQVKDTIDDMLNEWALKATAKDLTRALGGDKGTLDAEPSKPKSLKIKSDEAADEEIAVASEIEQASVADGVEPPTDEMPVIDAEDA